ncbi:MAG: ABC-F family ATP-binding cassette domain-containing protein [Cyclobacteriaceae bacterium]|nr:ABC-F family ATP-binding cassette domain-containing protein [Cyclobacteriaceae bacterium]
MNYLSVESITKSYNEKPLFTDITFGISKGEKVALVGRNGCGKSSLMNLLAGKDTPDAGQVVFKKDLRIAFLSQNPEFDPTHTVKDAIFSYEDEKLETILAYENAIHNTQESASLEKIIEKMDLLQAWDYEVQVKQILGKLGIHDLDEQVVKLSGGQRKRIALASVLINRPDFLILDEPTNHLDLEAIEWLENYLSGNNLTLLLVTHDRYFLESVTDQILEIDQGQIFVYKGNYSYFLEQRALRQQQLSTETEKARNLMVKELDWIRRQPKARGTKAKYRIDAFEQLKDKANQKHMVAEVQIATGMRRLGKKVLELENIVKKWDDQTYINKFSYVFKKGDKVGVIGKNGTGKSTFLNIIAGIDKDFTGVYELGETVDFGYYKQEDPGFDESQRVIDIVKEVSEIVSLANGSSISASQFLQHFLFTPEMQYTPVGKLSGGEKKRLQLLMVLLKQPNFIILDEPTNDLDIFTLSVLEDFLIQFEGILLIVSHDRFFMDRLASHSFVFNGDGRIGDFPGNYSQYRASIKSADEFISAKGAGNTKKDDKPPEKSVNKKKLSFREIKELELIESEIQSLEEKKQKLIQLLNEGSTDHNELMSWSSDIEHIDEEIEMKTLRWIELEEKKD